MEEIEEFEARKLIDLPTVIFVLLAGVCLRVLGACNFDILTTAFGGREAKVAQVVIGPSAVWQLFRQRLG